LASHPRFRRRAPPGATPRCTSLTYVNRDIWVFDSGNARRPA
jgi:hypothetical protein